MKGLYFEYVELIVNTPGTGFLLAIYSWLDLRSMYLVYTIFVFFALLFAF